MKLFDGYEAVKFQQENMIFVTHDGYLYYVYEGKYKYWKKYSNAGNVRITVENYADVNKEELMDAMNGVFPQKETDLFRIVKPWQLCIGNMLSLLEEDYQGYMSNRLIYDTVREFLRESKICYKSYLELKKLFDNARKSNQGTREVLDQIKQISFNIIGRDIFKREIGIVDGHDSSSYFWIQPVRIIDSKDTDSMDNVAEMSISEISIEEDDVNQYLTPFLYKYFDGELEANKNRADADGFEWYLTHNFFSFDSIKNILRDMEDTINALASGRENEFTVKLREKSGVETYEVYDLEYSKNLSKAQIAEYNAKMPKEDHTEKALIIDFYQRFIYRMEYMMRVGAEKGYNLISFMGP